MRLLAKSSTAATEPMRLLLLALLACAAGASICDTANCGMGNCIEVPEALPHVPNYECHCDPGWSNDFIPLRIIPFTPCIVPNCSFDGACLNLSLPQPLIGIPKDVCAIVSCGKGGTCKTGDGGALFNYSCECQPGYDNLLNHAELPCVKNCFFGKGCSALGLGPAPAPSPQPSPPSSPAPTGGHDSPGTSASPSGTKGSVPSWYLLQLLLLVTLAMAHVM